MKTAVLLIGFGGPARPEEVKPFLFSIVDGTKVPEARIQDVLHHYEVIGGVSPFNEESFKQRMALEQNLKARGLSMPVGLAFRHSSPGFKDAFQILQRHGVERVVGFVLASLRSFVSFQWYQDKVLEGMREAGAQMEIVYTEDFHNHPLFIKAQAEKAQIVLSQFSTQDRESTFVVFTAHSIPSPMCEQSTGENANNCYGHQFYEIAQSVAHRLLLGKNWGVCYQSRTGNPRDRWLEDDVNDYLKKIDKTRYKRVLLVPAGFLCSNVEIMYDLDVAAKKTCAEIGLEFYRAEPVGQHPDFIEMMAQQILSQCPELVKL